MAIRFTPAPVVEPAVEPAVEAAAAAILGDARVAYVHLRSACNNCYQARIDRG